MKEDEEIELYEYLLKGCGFLIWTFWNHSNHYCVLFRYHDEKNTDFRIRQP